MRNLKQFLSTVLAGTMLLALAACGQQTPQQSDVSSQEPESQIPNASVEAQPQDSSQPEAGATDNSDTGSSILVVYYSASGHTETVAGYIADALGADTLALTPATPYTDADLNYNDPNSRVVAEYEDETLRNIELVANTADNWDSYDTVFIGYPIWWGIAAWPVNGFVEANDFTGKTVIPFATSASSDMGESGELLAELAGTGDWQEGQRFRSSATEADVTEWVNGLEM